MIIVRKATLNDSEIIAAYLLLAMEEIVFKFIGDENPEKVREFMLHFVKREDNQYSYQNCWVAEVDRGVAAVINLYNGAQLYELRRPVIEYLKARHNRVFIPEDETHDEEYYIDTLGVNPNHQSKGIGTALLQFVIDEYINKRNQTIGLLVDERNTDAKKIVFKISFKITGKKVLFGKNMETPAN